SRGILGAGERGLVNAGGSGRAQGSGMMVTRELATRIYDETKKDRAVSRAARLVVAGLVAPHLRGGRVGLSPLWRSHARWPPWRTPASSGGFPPTSGSRPRGPRPDRRRPACSTVAEPVR